MPSADGMPTAWEAFSQSFASFEDYLQFEYMDTKPPVPSNIPPLDDLLSGGFRPGLSILGGAPGDGKSAFLLFLAMMMALSKKRVLYVSAEMSRRECVERCASFWSLYTGKEFSWSYAWKLGLQAKERAEKAAENGTFDEFQKQLAADPMALAIAKLQENCSTLIIADNDALRDVAGIEDIIMRGTDCGAEVIIVDYLQYLNDGDNKEEYSRVTDISKRLNTAGQRYGVPVIAASAVNRETNKKAQSKDYVPNMHGLKGSGQLDYDAVLACIIDQDPEQNWKRRLHIVKVRYGRTTNAETCLKFSFDGAHNSFELLS